MSTVDAGQATEQQSEPTSEAGCKDEVSRNVQGTDLRSGFAQQRDRACQMAQDAKAYCKNARQADDIDLAWCWKDVEIACHYLTNMLDARSNAKDETR